MLENAWRRKVAVQLATIHPFVNGQTVTRYTFKYSVSYITSPSHAQYLFTFIYPDPGPGTLGTLGTLAQLTLSSQVLASDKWKCQIKARPRISILVLVFSLIRDSELLLHSLPTMWNCFPRLWCLELTKVVLWWICKFKILFFTYSFTYRGWYPVGVWCRLWKWRMTILQSSSGIQ